MIDYNDKKVWDLFAEGKTKGIFQLESNLGKAWSKRLAPSNIEELSALIAIIRVKRHSSLPLRSVNGREKVL